MKRKALWGFYGGSEVRQRSPISRKHGSHGLTFPQSIKDILIGKPYRQHASLGSLLTRGIESLADIPTLPEVLTNIMGNDDTGIPLRGMTGANQIDSVGHF